MQGDLSMVLDDIGIMATMDWYCREFRTNHLGLGIEKNLGLVERSPCFGKDLIYRVMQEALSMSRNRARRAIFPSPCLKLSPDGISIKDNGIGFDREEAIDKEKSMGRPGLISMKERTEHTGGCFGVNRPKGKGTTVRASVIERE